MGGPRHEGTPWAMSTLNTQILVSNRPCPREEQGSLEKWATPEQGQGRVQDGPGTPTVSPKLGGMHGMVRSCKRTPRATLLGLYLTPDTFGASGATRNIMVALDHNPLIQVRVHESTWIQTSGEEETAGPYSGKPINKCQKG